MQYITWIVTKNSPLPLYLQREKLDDPLMKGYSSSPTKVTAAGIETTVTIGDAVRCGLDKAAVHPTVVIVGEDVDLIVLLMGLTQPNINVFFMKPERGKVETKLFSVRQLQQLPFAKTILLLHSFSGCDTTSAIHGKSKVGTAKLFTAKPDLTQNISDIFSELSTSPEII